MESSIAVFLTRRLACELLPTSQRGPHLTNKWKRLQALRLEAFQYPTSLAQCDGSCFFYDLIHRAHHTPQGRKHNVLPVGVAGK